MTPKEKAEDLVNQYRMVLMDEDTECGNEILCTSIACENALITVNEMIELIKTMDYSNSIMNYLLDVRCELNTILLGESDRILYCEDELHKYHFQLDNGEILCCKCELPKRIN